MDNEGLVLNFICTKIPVLTILPVLEKVSGKEIVSQSVEGSTGVAIRSKSKESITCM